MVVHDGDPRPIEGAVVPMYRAREVDIFGIKEISFVKQACLFGGSGAEKHKAAAEVRSIDRQVMVQVS